MSGRVVALSLWHSLVSVVKDATTSEIETCDETVFLNRIADGPLSSTLNVCIDGGNLPVRTHVRHSKTLIVVITGAVDRRILMVPQFGGLWLNAYVPVSELCISDRSPSQSLTLTAAW